MRKSTKELRQLRQQIGQNIHKYRVERKVTLKYLGEIMKMSPDLIDRYEIGRNDIGITEIARFSGALDVSLGDLIGL